MFINLFICLLIGLCYAIARYYQFVSKYPKGPAPLPFIGNSFTTGLGARYELVKTLSKGYDGMCTVFFPHPVVQIKDYALIREAYIDKGDDFLDRPRLRMLSMIRTFTEDGGVINSNGDIWREQRQTSISILKEFGIGKNQMEHLINSSIREYLDHISDMEEKRIISMRWPIQIMIANIMNELLFGFRFEYTKCDTLIRYVEDVNKILAAIGRDRLLQLGFVFPFLNKLPWISYHTLHKHTERANHTNQYIIDCVARAMENYKEDADPNCLVHAYKQRMKHNDRLDDANLMATCADFFFAGQETTMTTLYWAMLLLAKYPVIQDKLREEILMIVGKDRLPSLKDQTKLIYTRAVILEIQRFSNILQSPLRMTSNDTEVGGQFIPKGTIVIADIAHVMSHDPAFVEPEKFLPERYLTDDGKGLKKDLVDRTIPFSLGKRACSGESLARAELFLVLTATIQHYYLSEIPSEPIDFTPLPQPVRIPKEQRVILGRVQEYRI